MQPMLSGYIGVFCFLFPLMWLDLLPGFLLGQQDAKIAFYQQNLQLYNPAATGIVDQTNLSSNIRSQLQGRRCSKY
jgi:hypothetical protein